MSIIYENLLEFTWQQGVMILIGALLIFLAIKKEMEPTLWRTDRFGCNWGRLCRVGNGKSCGRIDLGTECVP